MNSENDKKLTRWLLTINMTQSQMREMGVDPQTNLQQTSNISSISSRGLSQTYTSGPGRKKGLTPLIMVDERRLPCS